MTRKNLKIRPVLAFILALWLIGCAPRLVVSSVEPGPIVIGPVQEILVIDGQGRRSARDYLIHETHRQLHERGYFRATDASSSPIRVEQAGRTARIEGGRLSDGQAVLRIDVYEWTGQTETREEIVKDRQGNEQTREVSYGIGTVVFGATLVDSAGTIILAEREYEATTEVKTRDRNAALEAAGAIGISEMLNEISPRFVRRRIRFDNRDKSQEAMIHMAQRGDLHQAASSLMGYTQRNPNNSSAKYNLALILDALGRFEEALELYDEALSMSQKPPRYYRRARDGCLQRLYAQRALSQ